MGVWDSVLGFFGGQKAPISTSGPSSMSSIQRTGRPPARGTAQMLQAYGDMPRLRAVVEKVATSIAAVPWQAHALKPGVTKDMLRGAIRKEGPHQRGSMVKRLTDHGLLKPLSGHPALDLLNKPHPDLTAAQVRETIQDHIELVGEAFIAIERTGNGYPKELWPVVPSWVRRLPQQGQSSYQVVYPGAAPRDVPSEDMIWIRKVNPANPYGRGCGLGATANNELDSDEYAARTTSARFWNNATPDLLVNVKGMQEDDLVRLKQRWFDGNRGYRNAALPHFSNSDTIDVKQLSSNFVDLDLVNLRKFLSDTIREIWGVPPEIMGNVTHSNRATITQAQRIFAMHVLIPRLDALEDVWNAWLVPQFEKTPTTVLLYEDPTPDDKDFSAEVMRSANFAFSLDDIRAMAGLAALPNKKGEVHPVPLNIVMTDVANLENASAPAISPTEANPGDTQEPTTSPGAAPPTEAPKNDDAPPPDAGKRVRPRSVKALDDDRIDAVLGSVDAQRLARPAVGLWRVQLGEWVQNEAADYGETVSIDVVGPLIEDHVQEFAGERINGINETTRSQLANTLAAGIEDGDTQREMIARVQDVFDEASAVRADTIARTEANRSSNYGITEGQRLAGIEQREWIANADGATRDAHLALDGQVVGIDEPFTIEGDEAMYPGDFDDPALSVNCRCTTSGKVDEKAGMNRKAVWKRFDRKLTAWERRAAVVFRAGFKAQEKAAVAAVKHAFAKKVAA